MSAYGGLDSCNICYCRECKFRKIKCNPCMDCTGHPNNQVIDQRYENGYIPIDNPMMCKILKKEKI